jgi:hypothetical protein
MLSALSLFATSMFARDKVAVKVMLAVEVLAANPALIHYERSVDWPASSLFKLLRECRSARLCNGSDNI